ncbi:hypothetical protein WJX74_001974 [Apatococcus lobatus]|uniref:Uncharacterized protein n=1 Tax=Apatococcus lobatus TaxID=904363 RepID=A0AAW1QLP1_9CHLO
MAGLVRVRLHVTTSFGTSLLLVLAQQQLGPEKTVESIFGLIENLHRQQYAEYGDVRVNALSLQKDSTYYGVFKGLKIQGALCEGDCLLVVLERKKAQDAGLLLAGPSMARLAQSSGTGRFLNNRHLHPFVPALHQQQKDAIVEAFVALLRRSSCSSQEQQDAQPAGLKHGATRVSQRPQSQPPATDDGPSCPMASQPSCLAVMRPAADSCTGAALVTTAGLPAPAEPVPDLLPERPGGSHSKRPRKKATADQPSRLQAKRARSSGIWPSGTATACAGPSGTAAGLPPQLQAATGNGTVPAAASAPQQLLAASHGSQLTAAWLGSEKLCGVANRSGQVAVLPAAPHVAAEIPRGRQCKQGTVLPDVLASTVQPAADSQPQPALHAEDGAAHDDRFIADLASAKAGDMITAAYDEQQASEQAQAAKQAAAVGEPFWKVPASANAAVTGASAPISCSKHESNGITDGSSSEDESSSENDSSSDEDASEASDAEDPVNNSLLNPAPEHTPAHQLQELSQEAYGTNIAQVSSKQKAEAHQGKTAQGSPNAAASSCTLRKPSAQAPAPLARAQQCEVGPTLHQQEAQAGHSAAASIPVLDVQLGKPNSREDVAAEAQKPAVAGRTGSAQPGTASEGQIEEEVGDQSSPEELSDYKNELNQEPDLPKASLGSAPARAELSRPDAQASSKQKRLTEACCADTRPAAQQPATLQEAEIMDEDEVESSGDEEDDAATSSEDEEPGQAAKTPGQVSGDGEVRNGAFADPQHAAAARVGAAPSAASSSEEESSSQDDEDCSSEDEEQPAVAGVEPAAISAMAAAHEASLENASDNESSSSAGEELSSDETSIESGETSLSDSDTGSRKTHSNVRIPGGARFGTGAASSRGIRTGSNELLAPNARACEGTVPQPRAASRKGIAACGKAADAGQVAAGPSMPMPGAPLRQIEGSAAVQRQQAAMDISGPQQEHAAEASGLHQHMLLQNGAGDHHVALAALQQGPAAGHQAAAGLQGVPVTLGHHGPAGQIPHGGSMNLPEAQADIPAALLESNCWNQKKTAWVRTQSLHLLAAGPQGDSTLPELRLVKAHGKSFPPWTLKSKDGTLLLRLLFSQNPMWQFDGLDAAVITGVSFTTTNNEEPAHVTLNMTLPAAYIMTGSNNWPKYKAVHKMEAACELSTPVSDRLYGFQAVPGQHLPQSPGPRMFKSNPCIRAAISIPLSMFVTERWSSHYAAGGKQLNAELKGLAPAKQAAFAVAWLWLESCIKGRTLHKP